jgi:hypothetical protein
MKPRELDTEELVEQAGNGDDGARQALLTRHLAPDAYLREYPAQAEGLERLVPTVQGMAELGRASAAGAVASAESRADELAGLLRVAPCY